MLASRRLFIGFLLASCVVAFSQSVRLQWDPNPETDLAGYRVHRGVAPGTRIESRDVGNITTYDFTNVVRAVTNYFTVTAYNTAGLESDPSNELFYKVPENDLPPVGGFNVGLTVLQFERW